VDVEHYRAAILLIIAAVTAGAIVAGSGPLVAWSMIAAGVVILLQRPRPRRWPLHDASGVVYVAVGLVLALNSDASPVVVALFVALFLGLQGLFRIVRATTSDEASRWPLIQGVIGLVLAVVTGLWAAQRVVIGLVFALTTLHRLPAPGLRVIGLFIVLDMVFSAWPGLSTARVPQRRAA